MAANTMDIIKKKMQAMRVEKEAARDRAERFEEKLLQQRTLNEQVQAMQLTCSGASLEPVDYKPSMSQIS